MHSDEYLIAVQFLMNSHYSAAMIIINEYHGKLVPALNAPNRSGKKQV